MKISVALCTYNGEKFLRKQIESILNQTYKVDKIVVSDDCSTDSTLSILEEYRNTNPNLFQIHQNTVNLKSNKNFEKAIELCDGDFIFLSDQDDIWSSDKVEKTLKIFDENPDSEAVFSNAWLINEEDQLISENITLWDTILFSESKLNKPIDLLQILLAKGNFLTGATLCLKREVKNFCFPFITSDILLHDEWFALILSKRKTLYYTNEKLISYRLHDSQQVGVGDIEKFINPCKKSIRSQNIILKLREPSTFSDYKLITNTYYSQYEKFTLLQGQNPDSLIIKEVNDMLVEILATLFADMKKKHPIRYFFRSRKNEKKGRMQFDSKKNMNKNQ